LLNIDTSSTCPHNMVNFGLLTAEICWRLGHPCKFQRISHLGSVTVRHSSSGRQPNFAALNRGRHLYLAGQPSRWALAHILVWLFLALSATFLFVCEISREPLNGLASNSQGRRVWSLARTSMKVKVTTDKNGIFSALSAACVRFMFGKTTFALVFSSFPYFVFGSLQ